MSVHIRGAEKDALRIIDKWRPRRCVLHWFTGSLQEQQEFVELGCYFSINANMLSNMDNINAVPKGRILVESDGPYSKVDGKKYEPMYLADVITKMVEYGSFDAAQEILNIICEERKVALEDIQLRQINELGSQPWRKYISCKELQVCKDMSSFVKLMKQVCCVENDL